MDDTDQKLTAASKKTKPDNA
ncbi:hypothetical protein OXX69_012827, partial [Metschnikowia pulcherrima]